MGKTLLILMVGFSASFGILAAGKNRRYVESVDRVVNQLTSATAKNAATSGAYMALNRLYLNPSWRGGYNNLVLGGNALQVTVKNDSLGATPMPYRVRISSSAGNADNTNFTEVVVFDRGFQNFAVWAKDTVISITAKDSIGAVNPNLIMQNAPFMPKIDQDNLMAVASTQILPNHYHAGNFQPADGYPNGSFDYLPGTANVTYVGGNLRVKTGRTVYGIFVIEGDVILEGGATVNGILLLTHAGARLSHEGGDMSESLVKGGVVNWGYLNASTGNVVVQHFPSYLQKLVSNYASDNPPLRVLSWK